MVIARAGEKGLAKLFWLDLRGSGLSVLERLCLEECLLKRDLAERNWLIVGCHEPFRNRYMTRLQTTNNESAAIVMGLGGKPENLLNIDLVRADSVLAIKRFSGGGTVVLDYDSIWVSIIGRGHGLVKEHFPRPIMEWTASAFYEPMFTNLAKFQSASKPRANRTMVLDTKSCSAENSGRVVTFPGKQVGAGATRIAAIPTFSLRENDYVLDEKKIGGNSQSIGKSGWLHHTSFLWDFQQDNMEYLTLPSKRPKYRGDRSHDDFLLRLKDAYPHLSKSSFFSALQETAESQFDLETVTTRDALSLMTQNGGFDSWFKTDSRNKIVDLSNY